MTRDEIIDKIRKVEALFMRTDSLGEMEAARGALDRLKAQFAVAAEPLKEWRFSLLDPWKRRATRPQRCPRSPGPLLPDGRTPAGGGKLIGETAASGCPCRMPGGMAGSSTIFLERACRNGWNRPVLHCARSAICGVSGSNGGAPCN